MIKTDKNPLRNKLTVILIIAVILAIIIMILTGCSIFDKDAEIVWKRSCTERCIDHNMSMEKYHVYQNNAKYDNIVCVCISYITLNKG